MGKGPRAPDATSAERNSYGEGAPENQYRSKREQTMATTRFVVLSDTHILHPTEPGDGVWWNRHLRSRTSGDLAQAWATAVRGLSPDFVLHCGDLTQRGDEESALFAKNLLDGLGCPVFTALGNHDTGYNSEGLGMLSEVLAFPGGKAYYAAEVCGLRVLALPYITQPDPEFLEEELAWLTRELAETDGKPVIFFTHAPLCLRDSYPEGTVPGPQATIREHLETYLWQDAERILQLLDDCRDLLGIFCGHMHTHEILFPKGMLHCATASLVSFPIEFREVTITGREVSIRTIGLDDASFAAASLMPERNNQWVAGRPEDRNLTGFARRKVEGV